MQQGPQYLIIFAEVIVLHYSWQEIGTLIHFHNTFRVLARISKIPVQNSNFKISVRPDLATYLLQILKPATINSLVCQKGQFTPPLCPRRCIVRTIFDYYTQKVKIEKSS